MSRSKRRLNFRSSLIFLLALFTLILVACGDQDGDMAVLTLTAEPANLPADGYSQSLLQATLVMADGEAVRDRTEVKFSIVSGEGKIARSSETKDGVAYAMLTSSSNPGAAVIRAKAQGSIAEITVNYDAKGPAIISIAPGSPSPATVNIAGTGGIGASHITWEVRDVYGDPVGDGYRVDFELVKGPGGGEVIEPASATTREGQVHTVLRSGSKPGPVTIKASYHGDDLISDTTTQIAIAGGPPAGEEFGIFAEYFNISGLYLANLQDPISVNVADIYGNAVPDGTAVSFKTYNTGGFFSPNAVNTTGGLASSDLHSSGDYAQPLNGFVFVTAEVDGGSNTHVRAIAVDPKAPNIMFAGTSGGGVYKSTNGGSSWENVSRTSEHNNLGQNVIDPYVNDICINPDNPEIIYVATGYEGRGSIYRSLNGGLTWNSNNPAEVFGLLRTGSAVLTVLCDDGSNYVWAGTRGDGFYYASNGRNFQQQDTDLPNTVRDIKKASGVGASATLYAATPTGVYKSVNGGSTWTRVTDFRGDNITTLAVHPDDSNTLYAGTQEYGVYYSTDGGETWSQYAIGLGYGLKASSPVADAGNIGSGLMSAVTIGQNTKTESWTVVYDAESGRWQVNGTASGQQRALGETGEPYVSDGNEVEFQIVQGSKPFEDGDAFSFQTVRDTGMNIKALQVFHSVSARAYYLYAVTHAFGGQEYYAVGNVYSVELDPGQNYRPRRGWQEASINLPRVDMPNRTGDNPLYAQHALAVDNPNLSGRLFIGGEGINFYQASRGLSSGNPVWEASRIGLTNRLMARMPILFTYLCSMTVDIVNQEQIVQLVPIEVEEGEEPEFEEVNVWLVTFEVYIQDYNGNPPIVGSSFTVEQEVADGDDITLADVDYPNTYTYPGTWRDRSNPETDIPFVIQTIIAEGDKVVFNFDPECGGSAPGCSGDPQEVIVPWSLFDFE